MPASSPPLQPKSSKKILIFVKTTIIFIPLLWSLFDHFTFSKNKCGTQNNLNNPLQTQGDVIINIPSKASGFEKDKDEARNKKKKKKKEEIKTIDCNVYLAESSIPNAGLGVFMAKDLPKKGVLTENDLPIIVTDIEAHNNNEGGFEWLLDNYYWSSSMVDAHHEAYSVSVAMPSFGMLGNNQAGLQNSNMEWNTKRNPRFHRSNDPGAGAVSDYRTMSWFATRPISAGEEVFLWYGEGYFTERESVYGMIPFRDNYIKADNITKEFTSIIGRNDLNDEKKQNLWKLMKAMTGPRTRSALPSDVASAYDAAEIGTARYSLPNSIRSIEWLEKNGQCMDNLKVRHSKLPQAGRGAFASRFIGKGSLVAPVPLVQILERDRLNMYELKDNSRINDDVIGKQLILNYCFGHPDSSLLLFPYSSAVQFINHSSKNYNAKIRWSTSKFHRSDWLEAPIENMTLEHTGLMFDIVATKDIRPDDEVLIDYGNDWDNAWKTHVKNWKPVESATNFVYPETMNDDDRNSIIRTLKEQSEEPYASNVETACYYYRDVRKFDIESEGDRAKVNVKWYYDDDEDYEKVYLRPCTIIERYHKQNITSGDIVYYYKAQMFNHNEHGEEDIIPTNEEHIVFDIPRHAIEFIGKTYSSDVFLRNAFRHYIGVPDDLFPSIWMNRADEVFK